MGVMSLIRACAAKPPRPKLTVEGHLEREATRGARRGVAWRDWRGESTRAAARRPATPSPAAASRADCATNYVTALTTTLVIAFSISKATRQSIIGGLSIFF